MLRDIDVTVEANEALWLPCSIDRSWFSIDRAKQRSMIPNASFRKSFTAVQLFNKLQRERSQLNIADSSAVLALIYRPQTNIFVRS